MDLLLPAQTSTTTKCKTHRQMLVFSMKLRQLKLVKCSLQVATVL